MTGSLIVGGALAVLLISQCGGEQDRTVMSVDICDLMHRPGDYLGKIVRVQGEVYSGWSKNERPVAEFSIKQPFSSVRCLAQLKVVLPERVKPSTGVELRRDDAFKKLDQALHTSMTIAATFQGKFESTAKTTAGKLRQSDLRLVLQQVSDVDAHVVYNK